MNDAVNHAVAELPEVLRPSVALWFEHLQDRGVTLPNDVAAPVAHIVACSEFAATVIARDIDWFLEAVDSFQQRVGDGLLDDLEEQVASHSIDPVRVKSAMRQFRNRFLLRILWRDLHKLADLDETLEQLSLLADKMLAFASHLAEEQLRPRFGQVRGTSGEIVPLVILGMGKLGGRELNFSSDIDLIFCFSENGETDGNKTISAHEYFARLSRLVIALIDEPTADGFVFRVDTRLRPFGDSGPPVVSFAALESYLLQHGRDWERYAYVKARVVGRQPHHDIIEELQSNLIRPFVYRRYLDYGVYQSVREMQRMIATEVRRHELADNVKLGPGGIREAEFIVQAMQLVRGGSELALQNREFQKVLPLLVSERGLSKSDADELRSAYRYLRRIENFIQSIRDQQTHDLPSNEVDRARLCLAMKQPTWSALLAEIDVHRNVISEQFGAIALRGDANQNQVGETFRQLWELGATVDRWAEAILASGADDAHILAEKVVEFASTSTVQQIDTVASQRLQQFVPRLLSKVIETSQPASALTRTLMVAERILRRSAYLALLIENEQALSRLVDLCEKSQYIAKQIAQFPALLDELLDPRSYTDNVTKDEIANEVQRRLAMIKGADSEQQMRVIAQFQRAAMFRIAIADFNDNLPIMKVSDALTWLAEVVLNEALRVAWGDLTAKHGAPCYLIDGTVHAAGFGIVAYGKLGGLELSYGSDLDIVFLHDSSGEEQRTDGENQLDNALFFSRLVRRLVHFLTTQTGSGELYEIDTRLRPDGRSGLLVSNTDAFERYQEENAWTWEHQALLRARAVAGSDSIAKEFERIRHETLANRVRLDSLKADVVAMRQRMRQELDRSNAERFDVKHGLGGVGDIEFLVQYKVLKAANKHDTVTQFSDNVRQIDALIDAGLIDANIGRELQNIYRAFRLWSHRLVLDGREALCGVDKFKAERGFVSALWDDWLA